MKAAMMGSSEKIAEVYAAGRREALEKLVDLRAGVITQESFASDAAGLKDTEILFSTWGMLPLKEAEIASLPALKAVFYAAGSVQGFARPFLNRGVKVFSAWAANAIPVAEFTMAQIILSFKRYFANTQACRNPELRHHGPVPRGVGAYNDRVALIGAGMIGRKVVELLKPFGLEVVIVDPYLPDDAAAAMGVKKVPIDEAFRTAYVVSNHLPNLPATVGMLSGKLFASMRENATFINTGRGAQVNEPEMLEVLAKRPDLTALLDVTLPEPPVKDSPMYTLTNVHLSSHIAGSLGNEVVRMADFMIDEFGRYLSGQPLRYEVSLKMLDTMA